MITIADKTFSLFIEEEIILDRIQELATELNSFFAGSRIHILVVLDGAEYFSKQVLPLLQFEFMVHYCRIKTYKGSHSSGNLKSMIELPDQLEGHHVLILEDIIDTGYTVQQLILELEQRKVAGIHVLSLLIKPGQLKYPLKPGFTGFEIGPEFVVGFGMDYREEGRVLPAIYRCIN